MLILEYKLRTNKAQAAAIDEAIRTVQFIRNKCIRLWMDGQGIGDNDLQVYCAQLAHEYPFAARLNSMARQQAADRAWYSIARFYKNCKQHKPGKKGYPRFQKDNRSVEYKTSGWRLAPDGKRLTFTDGHSIGTVRLIGTRSLETFPVSQIKRVRLLSRADGYYVQFAVQAERQIAHQPTGKQIGIDVGLKAFYTDSEGTTVANPRYFRKAELRLIVAVSPRYTTQDCSGCGYRVQKTLSMRTHRCPICGLVIDRDHNAALNNLALALRTAGQAETDTLRGANASGQTAATAPLARARRTRAG